MSGVVSFFKGFIPKYISDRVVMACWKLSDIPVSAKQRQHHLSCNKHSWKNIKSEATANGFIEKQDLLTDMVLGNAPASYNSCEVIALYNSMRALGDKLSDDDFPHLLGEFEKAGLAMGGRFGTTPSTLIRVLKKHGHDIDILKGRSITKEAVDLMSKRYHVFITSVYNDRNDISQMIHTVCINRSKDEYLVHNAHGIKKHHDLYRLLFAMNDQKSRPILLIGIR